MLFRLFSLIALIGVVGGDARSQTRDEDEPEVRLGGEGFGNIVMLAVVLGALILLGIIALAVLGLSGQFENELTDPAA